MVTGDSIKNIRWLGHSGFYIQEKPVIYIDPYDLAFPEIGDLILVTQNQKEKCSPDDIKWLRKGSTIIILPEDCKDKFEGDIRPVKAGDVINAKGATMQVMPACKKFGSNGKCEANGVGYIITFTSGLRVYHAGSTGLTPEMKPGITDVLLLPFGDAVGLDAAGAAEIASAVQPKVVIPMDWEKNKANASEFETFKTLCDIKLMVLKPKR